MTLALENNYDIAIARINLDIADTDLLRAKAGSTLRGVSTGLVQNTLGGQTQTILTGGGPGATSTASRRTVGAPFHSSPTSLAFSANMENSS